MNQLETDVVLRAASRAKLKNRARRTLLCGVVILALGLAFANLVVHNTVVHAANIFR